MKNEDMKTNTNLSNSLEIMIYGWLRHDQPRKGKLTGGLCLAFDPAKRQLTISRKSAVNEFDLPLSPPSEREKLNVLNALQSALAAEAAWIYQEDGFPEIEASNLLMLPAAAGMNWYLYRLTWRWLAE